MAIFEFWINIEILNGKPENRTHTHNIYSNRKAMRHPKPQQNCNMCMLERIFCYFWIQRFTEPCMKYDAMQNENSEEKVNKEE